MAIRVRVTGTRRGRAWARFFTRGSDPYLTRTKAGTGAGILPRPRVTRRVPGIKTCFYFKPNVQVAHGSLQPSSPAKSAHSPLPLLRS
jgi:hypothetical protein